MFGLFKKKSEVEKLELKYKKLLEGAHQLSTTNRSKSDEKMYEANPKNEFSYAQEIFTYTVNPKNIEARYIRVKARNIMECPDYHPGAGGLSWIFSDEIIIN